MLAKKLIKTQQQVIEIDLHRTDSMRHDRRDETHNSFIKRRDATARDEAEHTMRGRTGALYFCDVNGIVVASLFGP